MTFADPLLESNLAFRMLRTAELAPKNELAQAEIIARHAETYQTIAETVCNSLVALPNRPAPDRTDYYVATYDALARARASTKLEEFIRRAQNKIGCRQDYLMCEKLLEGDRSADDMFAQACAAPARWIADTISHTMALRRTSAEDICQEYMIHARCQAGSYDPSKGVRFIDYVNACAVPQLYATAYQLEHGRNLDKVQKSTLLDMHEINVQLAKHGMPLLSTERAANNPDSLDALLEANVDHARFTPLFGQDELPLEEAVVRSVLAAKAAHVWLPTLNPTHQQIIALHHGINADRTYSLREVADMLDIPAGTVKEYYKQGVRELVGIAWRERALDVHVPLALGGERSAAKQPCQPISNAKERHAHKDREGN